MLENKYTICVESDEEQAFCWKKQCVKNTLLFLCILHAIFLPLQEKKYRGQILV